jgi:hypothetical protein
VQIRCWLSLEIYQLFLKSHISGHRVGCGCSWERATTTICEVQNISRRSVGDKLSPPTPLNKSLVTSRTGSNACISFYVLCIERHFKLSIFRSRYVGEDRCGCKIPGLCNQVQPPTLTSHETLQSGQELDVLKQSLNAVRSKA